MVLSQSLLRFAAGRPHPFVIADAGSTQIRLAVEQELRRRGWPLAITPASASMLITCGDDLADIVPFVERTWSAIGEPRVRVAVAAGADAPAALRAGQRALTSRLVGPTPMLPVHQEPERIPADSHRHRNDDDHQQTHNGAHREHDMAGMEMPAGLPLPDRAEDRDGLKLDRLQVPLGPLLAHWPAGLVIQTKLQGDVIQQVEVEALTGAKTSEPPFWNEPWLRAAAGEPVSRGSCQRRLAAAHLDSLGRLLAVAGWDDAASHAQRLRDDLLSGVSAGQARRDGTRLARRLRRARTLHWLTNRLGLLTEPEAASAGVTGPALRSAGDVTARWTCWLEETANAIPQIDDPSLFKSRDIEGPRGRLDRRAPPSAALLAVLPRLLEGCELASARLIVASLDPDLDELRYGGWRMAGV